MKTPQDFGALMELMPKHDDETWLAWLSRGRATGLLCEGEWHEGVAYLKQHFYAFPSK